MLEHPLEQTNIVSSWTRHYKYQYRVYKMKTMKCFANSVFALKRRGCRIKTFFLNVCISDHHRVLELLTRACPVIVLCGESCENARGLKCPVPRLPFFHQFIVIACYFDGQRIIPCFPNVLSTFVVFFISYCCRLILFRHIHNQD